MRSAQEAGAEDGVGIAVLNRAEQGRDLGGVVFEVGVLHHNHITSGGLDRRADRGALAPVFRMMPHDVDPSLCQESIENRRAAVTGGVVDADNFHIEGDRPDPLDQGFEGRRFVIHRDQDRDTKTHSG